MKRLLSYLKPHITVLVSAALLTLLLIIVELYRPITVGNAIDRYINEYHTPYILCNADTPGAVSYRGIFLKKISQEELAGAAVSDTTSRYFRLFLYKDHYYMAEELTANDCLALNDSDPAIISHYAECNAERLFPEDLKVLRKSDFQGLIRTGLLYLVLLLSGFLLNCVSTWLLQKMGQKIIYSLREKVFRHIHSLSLDFFNRTPVGKLMTRVVNDTEAINELFTTVLVKLFKSMVKILGYAVVMLSIDVKLAMVSFALLPVVTILTFVFRACSRKAYRITRNKITELNTFLSEHLSGMRVIQVFAREKQKYDEFDQKSRELFRANWREIMTFAVFRPNGHRLIPILEIVVIKSCSVNVFKVVCEVSGVWSFCIHHSPGTTVTDSHEVRVVNVLVDTVGSLVTESLCLPVSLCPHCWVSAVFSTTRVVLFIINCLVSSVNKELWAKFVNIFVYKPCDGVSDDIFQITLIEFYLFL